MSLEKTANVAVIVGVAVFLFLVVRNQLNHSQLPIVPSMTAEAFVGQTINLPGLQFPQDHKSLVLALSTACHFCEASLPFYKELASKVQGQVNIVAILPQPQPEAEAYLQHAAIRTTQIISVSLDKVGVGATPTVLLVNEKGKVQAAWVGILDDKGQQQVLSSALPQLNSANTELMPLTH
jgi:thiol-disulfide isomerase/thioredoxin